MESKTCLIFDLDGTIIFENAPLSPKLTAAFASLAKSNRVFVFATARSLRGVRAIMPDGLLQHYLILCNGAFACHSQQMIYTHPMQKEVVIAISKLLDRYNMFYVIECGDSYYHPPTHHPFFDILQKEAREERMYSLTSATQKPVYKISVLGLDSSKDADHLMKHLQKYASSAMTVQHADGGCDLINRDTSKWNCFSNIVELSEFSHLVFFGNDENDLDMFEHIHESVLIGNHPLLSNKARHIIEDTDPQHIEDQILNILQEVL